MRSGLVCDQSKRLIQPQCLLVLLGLFPIDLYAKYRALYLGLCSTAMHIEGLNSVALDSPSRKLSKKRKKRKRLNSTGRRIKPLRGVRNQEESLERRLRKGSAGPGTNLSCRYPDSPDSTPRVCQTYHRVFLP